MREGLGITLCVDALEHELGGIGRYTWELSQRLPKRHEISSVRYFVRNRLIDDPARLLRGERIYPGRGLRRAGRAWIAGLALRSSVVHAPNYFLPRRAATGIITVHDLSVFRFPETHPSERIRQFERQFEDSMTRAVHVITDTETVRRELIDTFGVSDKRVTAVALGVSDRFRPSGKVPRGKSFAKWGIEPGRYGLCVSALEPRKKVAELLVAWRRLPLRLRDRYPLVLAGGAGWRNDKIREQVNAGELEGWVRHLGHIDDVDLPQLYSQAALFVYPSIYEGFGLPPLEAMASGVPIVVANRSCLPEVCGDVPLYVDPDNDNEFLSTLEEALESNEWRAEAIRRGLERASRFTWNRCIEDTVAVYKDVVDH